MASDFSIKKNVLSSAAQSPGRDDNAGKGAAAAQGEKDAQSQQMSSRVTLSNDALSKMLDYGQAISRMATETAASKKDLARARVEEIKKRIEMLKKLLAMMGPAAAKSVLREIRQLAGQLSAAAETLKEGSGGASPANAGVGVIPMSAAAMAQPSDGVTATAQEASAGADQGDSSGGTPSHSAQAAAAYAKVSANTEVAASSDSGGQDSDAAQVVAGDEEAVAEPSGSDISDEDAVQAPTSNTANDASLRRAEARQREEDAKTLREVLRDLKALLALAKQMVERGDEEARKDVAASEEMIEDAAKATEGVAMGSVGAMPAISIPVPAV